MNDGLSISDSSSNSVEVLELSPDKPAPKAPPGKKKPTPAQVAENKQVPAAAAAENKHVPVAAENKQVPVAAQSNNKNAAPVVPPAAPIHPLLALLKRSVGIVGSMSNDKNNIGKQWQHMLNLEALGTSIFHPSIAKKATTKVLMDDITAKKKKGPKGWTKTFAAKSLFEIAKLLAASKKVYKAEEDAAKAMQGRSRTNKKKSSKKIHQPKDHPHLTAFKEYIRGLNTHIEQQKKAAVDKAGGPKKRRNRKPNKIGVQTGRKVQEGLQYNPDRAAKHSCPQCSHGMVMYAETPEQQAEYQREMDEYKAALADFERLSRTDQKKTSKPTMPKKLRKGLTMLCMCEQSLCNNRVDGVGCYNCETGATAGERPTLVRNPATGLIECRCDICKCNCSALYGSNERDAFARQCQLEKEEQSKESVQDDGPTASNPLGGVVGSFLQNTHDNSLLQYRQQYPYATPTQFQQAAASLTARSLMRNSTLQGDVQVRNQLQLFHPRTVAVNGDVGQGNEAVRVDLLRSYQREQRQQQQDNILPSFARRTLNQPHGSAMGPKTPAQVNNAMVANSNKGKRKATESSASRTATHRQHRNSLTNYNPVSEGKEDKEEEKEESSEGPEVIDLLNSSGSNNDSSTSNPFWPPQYAQSGPQLVQAGFQPDLVRDVLQQVEGDANQAALLLTAMYKPVSCIAAAPIQHIAPVQHIAPAPAQALAVQQEEPPNPAIAERRKKIRKTSLTDKDSPERSKFVYKGLVHGDPVLESILEDSVEFELPTQEAYKSMKDHAP